MTTLPDALSYERASARIARIMAAIAGAGAAVAFSRWGWKTGAGFLVGSLISGIQYYALKTVVDGLGGKKARGSGFRAALRFGALASLAYVIFRLTPVSLKAVLAGVFVLTLAVFFEVAIEIVYARK